MTHPTKRDVERRADALDGDTGDGQAVGWLDVLRYAEHVNEQGDEALTREEFHGEGWYYDPPGWDELVAAMREGRDGDADPNPDLDPDDRARRIHALDEVVRGEREGR